MDRSTIDVAFMANLWRDNESLYLGDRIILVYQWLYFISIYSGKLYYIWMYVFIIFIWHQFSENMKAQQTWLSLAGVLSTVKQESFASCYFE